MLGKPPFVSWLKLRFSVFRDFKASKEGRRVRELRDRSSVLSILIVRIWDGKVVSLCSVSESTPSCRNSDE